MLTSSPIIGITLDAEDAGGYSPLPWYALRKEYFSVIARLGGIPIALPHEISQISAYHDLIDGLLLTGGDFDIPPEMYGETTTHESVTIKSERTQFELAITQHALECNKPILGVCAGEQLLNVMLGGTLIQHIPDEIDNPLEHQQKTPRTEACHDVTILPDTRLHHIVGCNMLPTNSNHHQAVKTVGKDVIISAKTSDGVIEAIEYTKHPFCLGIEWHPELEVSNGDTRIMQAFIEAARDYRKQHPK